jgi:hypothetical protein
MSDLHNYNFFPPTVGLHNLLVNPALFKIFKKNGIFSQPTLVKYQGYQVKNTLLRFFYANYAIV